MPWKPHVPEMGKVVEAYKGAPDMGGKDFITGVATGEVLVRWPTMITHEGFVMCICHGWRYLNDENREFRTRYWEDE